MTHAIDLATAVRRKQEVLAMWRAGGGDTLVKVMPKGLPPDDKRMAGYCTTLKYVVGRTPAEMERLLGFRADSKLHSGADVYRVDPLPSTGQFEFRGYSQTPAGVAQVNGIVLHPDYPPGEGVPQWELSGYPQSGLKKLATVEPGQRLVCAYKSLPTRLSMFITGGRSSATP